MIWVNDIMGIVGLLMWLRENSNCGDKNTFELNEKENNLSQMKVVFINVI